MTVARPGDPFYFALDGTVIDGRYLEVDPPHRILIGWDRPATGEAEPTSALTEITLTPTDEGTSVTVNLSGLSGEDADCHLNLWTRYLERIADVFVGTRPSRELDD